MVEGDVCYVFIGPVCVSGTVRTMIGESVSLRLVTGHDYVALQKEVRVTSPKLEGGEWPL